MSPHPSHDTSDDRGTESESSSRRNFFQREDRKPLIGGVVTAALCLGGTIALGHPGDLEARELLEASLATLRFLCSAMIAGSSTILALMLTLLGLSFSTEHQLSQEHYLRIRRIALCVSIVIVGTLLFFLFLTVPVAESEHFPSGWFQGLYYSVLGIASMLVGWLATVVFMLYGTISDIVAVSGLGDRDHPLIAEGEESESP